MQLTNGEKSWIEDFRKSLEQEYPGAVQELLIYGSKARGQSHAESDLDVLLIVKDDAGARKRELRRIGYRLAATTEVLPSIFAYTQKEWESRKTSRSTFRKAVERDAVRVLSSVT